MKAAKAFTLALLLFTSLLFSQNTFKLGVTGAYPNAYGYTVNSGINWSYYKDLNLNTWSGWWIGDNAQGYDVIDKLEFNNMYGYFQPDSLRWAGYGRMQINEAEETSERFSYNGHRCGSNYKDETQFGYGQWVRYFNKNSLCNEEQGPSGLVLWNVKENGFQSFSGVPNDPIYQVHFPGDGASDPGYINKYYVKPRMRISIADTGGAETPVVKIIINKYDGNPLLERIVTNKNFRLANNTYDGSYLEEYKNITLSVDAGDLNMNRGVNDPAQLSTCQVDYQIYWYGTVSVWIDYVKVMDEAANNLLGSQETVIRHMLRSQIKRLNECGEDLEAIVKSFKTEEYDHCNTECLNYVISLFNEEAVRDRNKTITYKP